MYLSWKEQQAIEKSTQKAVENATCAAWITEDTIMKVFHSSLASYKKGDDLITLTGAYSLQIDGMVPEITARIKAYLDAHPELVQNTCFVGLFGGQ
jgi:hypothetical protein